MKVSNLLEIFNELCVELGLEDSPPILLTGKEAVNFVNNHFSKKKRKVKASQINGIFIYEDIDSEYVKACAMDPDLVKNGVICLIKVSESTLIHEMRHAYQFKNNCKHLFIENNKKLQEEYKKTYVYYPAERDAFDFTLDYLNKRLEKELTKGVLSKRRIKKMKRQILFYSFNYSYLKLRYYSGYRKILIENK